MPKIYLAGPDVFRQNNLEFFEQARKDCQRLGLEALTPLDLQSDQPALIWNANLQLIHQCDAVVANLNAFRGSEPDSGTVFECGFACALNKPVVGYLGDFRGTNIKAAEYFLKQYDHSQHSQLQTQLLRPDPSLLYPDSMSAEPWGYPVNLMLQFSLMRIVHGDIVAALTHLKTVL